MNYSRLSHRFAQVLLASCLVSIPLGLMLFWTPIPIVHASSMTVTTLDDTIAADGFCSLREAMTNANNNNQSGSTECTAGSAGLDTITFSVTGTITLGSQLPAITETLTINGPGASLLTISGNNLVRIMAVNAGTLNLSNVTLANGNGIGVNGGAIRNNATLVVTNTTFYSNTTEGNGGAVSNNGTASFANSSFISNTSPFTLTGGFGGAINSGAGAISLMITNTNFYTNSAAIDGGGVRVGLGTATIVNSTFSGNSAPDGGGIQTGNSATLAVSNTSFYSNTASNSGGGINIGLTKMTIANSTFSGNSAQSGGGIQNNGTLTLTSGTFTGNIASYGGGIFNYLAAANITNTNFYSNTAINGGGINNDTNSTLMLISSSLSGNQATNGGGIYNNTSGTATLTSGVLTGNTALYGGGINNSGGTLSLTDTNLYTNTVTGDGGGLYNQSNGKLTVTNSTIFANQASNGGGLVNNGSTLMINNTTLMSNTATSGSGGGGGLYNVTGGVLTIINSSILGNQAMSTGGGGGTVNNFSTLTISNTTFTGNTASLGGGIDNLGGTLAITSTNFYTNSATDGGGLYNRNSGALFLTSSTLSGNLAGTSGGGLVNNSSKLVIDKTTFTSNTAVGWSGGGIYNVAGGIITMTNSSLSDNKVMSTGGGGGVINDGSTLTISNTTLFNNTASTLGGGGILNANSGGITIINSTLSDNAGLSGGGVSNSAGTATLRNTIVANSSSGGNCFGAITNGGNNIDDGTTCGWGSSSGSQSSTNPLLGPLANNGGATQTMALLTSSPAINAGNPSICPSTDQRGLPRRSGFCDVGAFEAQPASNTITGIQSQSAVFSTAFTSPLTVTVKDANANLLGGTVVTYTVPGSGASANLSSGTATTNASGVASVTATANGTAGGPYNVAANAAGLSAVNFSLTNLKADTTVTITNSSGLGTATVVGQSYPVTFSVSVVAPGGGTPTGNVNVSDGTNNCLGTVSAGTCNLTSTIAGTKTITATYQGDGANYNASPASSGVSHTVDQASTTTTLVSSRNPSALGQTVTFTATVAVSAPGGGTALGTADFKSDGTTITGCGAQTLSSGKATCVTSTLSLGTHAITADYSGNTNFITSTGTLAGGQAVNKLLYLPLIRR